MPVRLSASLCVALCLSLAGGSVAPAQQAPSDTPAAAPDESAPVKRKPRRRRATAPIAGGESSGGLAGRYAVMREKRDTGCMVTLDSARVKGGSVARLAPGCRDQGIVIFDPTMWALAGGALILTARAGHKTHLVRMGEGLWSKDPKEGGKPLGLKHL